MNADRIKPAPEPIRNKQRFRRLKTSIAKEIGRGEAIRNSYDLCIGHAFPDGRFETSRADNFRYARQLLHSKEAMGLDYHDRLTFVKVARHIRLDEGKYQAQKGIRRVGIPK